MDTEYLKTSVGKVLAQGIAETVSERPEDPIAYLAAFLLKSVDDEKADKVLTVEKKKDAEVKELEDDYLVGPLSIESYVIFRMRPLVDCLERQALKLSKQLQRCEISTYVINALGAVLAAINWTEWTSLTIAVVAVLTGIIEFTQLRNQLVQTNLSLRDLQSLLVRWDSLSIVTRRTPLVKAMFVEVTEDALLSIVDAHTTAASNTQTSVLKEMQTDAAEAEAQR